MEHMTTRGNIQKAQAHAQIHSTKESDDGKSIRNEKRIERGSNAPAHTQSRIK